MAGALQSGVGPMTRAEDMHVGVQLVGAEQRARPRHRHGMSPCRAPFRGDQVIPAGPLVEMRRLRQAERSPFEDVVPGADQLPLRCRIFLQHDAGEAVLPGTMVPQHVEQVLPPVLVVKERGIEAAAVQIYRVGPVAVDAPARHQIVVEVAQRRARGAGCRGPAVALDVGVDQMKEAAGMCQARRPDAAGVGVAAHVELTGAAEGPGDEAPVDEIAGVVNLHAREPLERRGRNVIVLADPDDRRSRVQTAKNRVENGAGHRSATLLRRSRRAAVRAPASRGWRHR